MTNLTETQALILRTASHHADGIAAPPSNQPPAPRSAVAKAMLKAGLLEVVDSTDGQHPGLSWKLDGEAMLLRITAAGLQAIGVAAEPGDDAIQTAQESPRAASDAEVANSTAEPAEPAQSAPTVAVEAVAVAEGLDVTGSARDAPAAPQDAVEGDGGTSESETATTGSRAPVAPAASLRDAARAVVAAWDDAAGQRAGLAAAVEALRAAIPPARATRPPREPGTPRPPRQGTKQETVLALLHRPDGASGPQMMEATGWAPHTVRGFLAGLKKRGVAVLVHERVRQVGPGKEGVKGSYTVYRIAAETAG